ncbi:uncharacterized protein [Clytia hemisphaerica]|uniref:Cnidarian restricted protein n=1 Tax=Clytia hemisphaerica TaxID=252671 RepID=A0A7M5UT50_9CNID|eukprot:TCONS_00064697-protein
MDKLYTVWLALIGGFLISTVSGDHKQYDGNTSQQYSDGELCQISATRKMLKSLGITNIKKCIINSKRDIANLVSTYLNIEPEYTRGVSQKRSNILQPKDNWDQVEIELDQVFKDIFHGKRERQYCCSPLCTPFMRNLGWPNPALISCEDK